MMLYLRRLFKAMSEKVQLHDKPFTVFLEEEKILSRIESIAQDINHEYAGATPVFMIVLKGAFMFGSELVSRYKGPCQLAFVTIRSYEGLKSTGKVQVSGLDADLIKGQDVIIIEDIVDSGRTLHEFLPILQEVGPASVKIATLLSKPEAMRFKVPVAYFGFEIPDDFVVGFGLDYDGMGRNLRDIYQLDQEA